MHDDCEFPWYLVIRMSSTYDFGFTKNFNSPKKNLEKSTTISNNKIHHYDNFVNIYRDDILLTVMWTNDGIKYNKKKKGDAPRE